MYSAHSVAELVELLCRAFRSFALRKLSNLWHYFCFPKEIQKSSKETRGLKRASAESLMDGQDHDSQAQLGEGPCRCCASVSPRGSAPVGIHGDVTGGMRNGALLVAGFPQTRCTRLFSRRNRLGQSCRDPRVRMRPANARECWWHRAAARNPASNQKKWFSPGAIVSSSHTCMQRHPAMGIVLGSPLHDGGLRAGIRSSRARCPDIPAIWLTANCFSTDRLAVSLMTF